MIVVGHLINNKSAGVYCKMQNAENEELGILIELLKLKRG